MVPSPLEVPKSLNLAKRAKRSSWVLWTIITLSFFAPLLANREPLVLNATFPDEFSRSARLLPISARGLERSAPMSVTWSEEISFLHRSLALLRSHTGEGERALNRFAGQLERYEATSSTSNLKALQRSAQEVRDGFLGESGEIRVALKAGWSCPAFRESSFGDGVLMGLALVGGLLLFRHPKKSRATLLLSLILLPSMGGAFVHLASQTNTPALRDRTALSTSQAAVHFVVWPPIPFHPQQTDDSHLAKPPSLAPRHLAGTDGSGRDVFSLLLWGGKASLVIGIFAGCLILFLGMSIGAMAALGSPLLDRLLNRLMIVIQAIPGLLFAMLVIAFLERSPLSLILVIGFVRWPDLARLVRAELLKWRERGFFTASRALGSSIPRSVLVHLLPNALGPILVAATFGIADSILIESTLSFLGLGLGDSTASWGSLLGEARYRPSAWWLSVFPGLMIFASVLAFSALADNLGGRRRLRGELLQP